MKEEQKRRLGQTFVDEEEKTITYTDLRFYRNEETGNYVPSVTTILGCYPKNSFFYEWLKSKGEEADKIRDDAAYSGSIVHNLTESYDKGEVVSLLGSKGEIKFSSLEWRMLERYVDFTKTFKPEYESIEESFVNEKLGYAGTVDRVAIINGERILLDIKTSNNIHDTHFIQLAAYVNLYNQIYPEKPIDKIGILWLKARTRGIKDGKIQGAGYQLIEPPKELEHYQKLFEHTHALYNEVHGDSKPHNVTYKLEHKKQIKQLKTA